MTMSRDLTVRKSFFYIIGFYLLQPMMPCCFADVVIGNRAPVSVSAWALEQLGEEGSYFDQASLLFSEGKLDECRERLAKLKSANQTLPHPDLVVVWFLLAQRKLADAKLELELVAAKHARDPQVGLTLGQIALADGRLADAAAQLERTALLPLPSVWDVAECERFARLTLETLTLTYERQQRWSDAKSTITTLIQFAPNNPNYLIRLASAHFQLNETTQTKELLNQAAFVNGGATPADLLLAEIAFAARRFDDALAAIDEAHRKHPLNPNVHLWYAEWALVRRHWKEAEQALTRARDLGERSSRYWTPLGQLFMMKGQYDQAVPAFREALLRMSDETDRSRQCVLANLLAIALVCENADPTFAEPLAIAENNATDYPKVPDFVGTLGWLHLKCERPENAKALLLRAMELNPRISSDLSFYLADLYAALDDRVLANQFLDAALENDQGIFVLLERATQLSCELTKAK
jgi:tetratricopeptide (TPR) repeat protein